MFYHQHKLTSIKNLFYFCPSNVNETMYVCISVPLAVLIIGRDVLLVAAGFYLRFISLPPPVGYATSTIYASTRQHRFFDTISISQGPYT